MQNTSNQTAVVAVLAFFAGLVLTAFVSHGFGIMSGWQTIRQDQTMAGAMHSMTVGLSGKSGASFDRAFLDEMIVHHEGAILMAQQALLNAEHQELKDLARQIIDAQTREIAQMKAWRTAWF